MEQSRFILVVISRHSINKRWPAFEIEHAQYLAKCQGKQVFYVIYGNVGDAITPEVKQVLDSEIYIKWPEGVRNQQWVDQFFERLVGGIRGEGDLWRMPVFHAQLPTHDERILSHRRLNSSMSAHFAQCNTST